MRGSVGVAVLVNAADDDRVRMGFPDLLQFRRIDVEVAVVIEVVERLAEHARNHAVGEDTHEQWLGIGILQIQRVLDAARQEQCVRPGRPFAVIADEEVRFLLFSHAQAGVGAGLIVVLRHVPALLVEVFHREEYAVLGRNLELELT